MAFVLDSDTFSLLSHEQENVLRRFEEAKNAGEIVFLSVVAAEEAIQGALSKITVRQKQANTKPGAVEQAHDFLTRTLVNISRFPILPYTAVPHRQFRSFPASVRRVGANDCRIAASAMTSGLTIVTRNTRDYARIPGASFVDWAEEESPGDNGDGGSGPSVPPNLSQNVV